MLNGDKLSLPQETIAAGKTIRLKCLNCFVLIHSSNTLMYDLYACIGYQSDSSRSTIKLLVGSGKHKINYAVEGSSDSANGIYTVTNSNPSNPAYVFRTTFRWLNGDLQFASLTKDLDLDVAIEQRVYCETSSLIVGSLKNKPSSISDGEAIVIWLPSSVSNKFGCQLFLHTSENAQSAYLRHRCNTKWSGWGKITLS